MKETKISVFILGLTAIIIGLFAIILVIGWLWGGCKVKDITFYYFTAGYICMFFVVYDMYRKQKKQKKSQNLSRI